MKTLKALKPSPISTTAVNAALEIVEKEFVIQSVAVDDIATFVTAVELLEGFQELEQDIISNGMNNPLIITANSKEAYEHGGNTMMPDFIAEYNPDKSYLCLYGNQRLQIAKRNGYTEVDTVFVSTPFEAVTLQHLV